MSRTDKTRPYWVKVNDHGVEHHDHSMLGQPVWHTRNVTDEDGEIVYEELPFFYRIGELLADKDARLRDIWVSHNNYLLYERNAAGNIIHSWRWNRDNYKHGEVRSVEKIRSEAMWLRAHGKGSNNATLVPAGTYFAPKTERYIAYYIPDHCTIDEKPNMVSRWSNANPCYMEADWYGEFQSQFRCSCCSPQGYNGAKRAIARDTLKEVAKQYNSGEDDWEDAFDARENITPRRKAGQSWW